MNISGVYKITNKVNGKVYIGQSKHIEKRWIEHTRKLNKNEHHSKKLQRAWNKNGENNFEFEAILLSIDNLDDLELMYIDEYDSVNNGYNMIRDVKKLHTFNDDKKSKKKEYNKIRKEVFDNINKYNNLILKNNSQKIADTKLNNISKLIDYIIMNINDNYTYHIYVGGKKSFQPMEVLCMNNKELIYKISLKDNNVIREDFIYVNGIISKITTQ